MNFAVQEVENMITAIILINAELKAIDNLGDELASIPNVAEVYSVTGDYDFVAVVRVKEYDKVADTVVKRIAQLKGVIQHLRYGTVSSILKDNPIDSLEKVRETHFSRHKIKPH